MSNGNKTGNRRFILFLSLVFLIPFICIGIGMIASGIRGVVSGTPSGITTLVFGIAWCISMVFTIVYMTKAFTRVPGKMEKFDDVAASLKPAADNTTGEYTPPEKDPRFDYEWMKHDDCEADHDDDEDSVRKGYE